MSESKSISRKAKLAIYKTIIKPIVTYASETWVLTIKDEALIGTWERKALRKIFGPVNERNVWRIRSNQELRCMYQDLDLVKAIRKSRLKWLGHVHRRRSQKGPKMALEGNPGGRRRKGRPRKWRLDNVQDDMIKMGVKKWRKICQVAKVLQELYSHREEEEEKFTGLKFCMCISMVLVKTETEKFCILGACAIAKH
jgi:hypothetical protein